VIIGIALRPDESVPNQVHHILMRGAGYLLARQASGLLISAAGSLLLARFIGPGNYGIYASALAICVMLMRLTLVGLPVLLVSEPRELHSSTIGHAVAASMSVSVAGMLVATIAVWAIDSWIPLGNFVPAFLAMMPGIIIGNLIVVATALLERKLDYRRVALVEMTTQLTQIFVAVGIGYFVPSFWAPICGYWASLLLSFGMIVYYVRDVFRPVWSISAMARLLWSSLPFAANPWVSQLRELVNPIVVGATFGPSAVGIVALTLRLITAIGAMREIVRRLSLPGMRRLIDEKALLRGFAENARDAQIFLVGLPLLAFSFVLPQLEEWGIGRSWHGVTNLYPLLAIAYLIGTFSVLPVCALVILQQRKLMVANSAAQLLTLVAAAVVLTPRLGIAGYGIAEIVAAFASLIAVAGARRLIGPLSATLPIIASAALVAGFAWRYIGAVALLPSMLLPLSHRVRQFATRSIAELRALRGGSSSD
jgi:O-antigen/teichoic acid export membrane protein